MGFQILSFRIATSISIEPQNGAHQPFRAIPNQTESGIYLLLHATPPLDLLDLLNSPTTAKTEQARIQKLKKPYPPTNSTIPCSGLFMHA
jgi:hypothetical protein